MNPGCHSIQLSAITALQSPNIIDFVLWLVGAISWPELHAPNFFSLLLHGLTGKKTSLLAYLSITNECNNDYNPLVLAKPVNFLLSAPKIEILCREKVPMDE